MEETNKIESVETLSNDLGENPESEKMGESIYENLKTTNETKIADVKEAPQNDVTAENFQKDADEKEIFNLIFKASDDEFKKMLKENNVDENLGIKARADFISKATTQLFEKDLMEIKARYSFVTASNIKDIKNFDKFVNLRSHGLDAATAFEAVSGKEIAESFLKNRKSDGAAFLAMKKLGMTEEQGALSPIPKDELGLWQSAFPKDNLAELTKKFNKAKSNK